MNKVSNVSFKGIQNVGAGATKVNSKMIRRLVVQLTDEGKNDLTMFGDLFHRFPDMMQRGYLRFDYDTVSDRLEINGLPLHPQKENSRLIVQTHKLLEKIQAGSAIDRDIKKHEMLPIKGDYLKSNDCLLNFKLKQTDLIEDELTERIQEIHTPVEVNKNANIFADTVKRFFQQLNY